MCRVLADEGIKVAPFKAQNMSLNSFVTTERGEMGRAQVLQAMAARIAPDVLMNPVLLKPTGDQESQIIVNGLPWESLQARHAESPVIIVGDIDRGGVYASFVGHMEVMPWIRDHRLPEEDGVDFEERYSRSGVNEESRVVGYEIHHGKSFYKEKELFTSPYLGCRQNRIWGTYLHGVFENDGLRTAYLQDLGYYENQINGTMKKLMGL